MKKTIITGATGFVGANLARKLLAAGHEVHLLVRPGYAGWRVEAIRSQCQLHEVDLQDNDRLNGVIAAIKPDWVFHLAANGAYSWQTDVREIINTNLLGTVNLLESCATHGFDAFVNTGSSSEYGFKDHPPRENENPEPNSSYAVAKCAATMYCRQLAQSRKLHVPTLRLYSVYGPFEEPNRLMPTIIVNGLSGKLPPLVDPTIARDYISADDVCEAYLLAAEKRTDQWGEIYNVGSAVQTTLADVVDVARRVLDIKDEPSWGSMPNRKWDTSVWVSSNEKIKESLGWRVKDEFASGFAKMVDWFKSNQQMRHFYEERIEARAAKAR